jgi:hypothetical protein
VEPLEYVPQKRGGSSHFCLSGITGLGFAVTAQGCYVIDRKGLGFTGTLGSGAWAGAGAAGSVGTGFSNGSLDDQAGLSHTVELQGFAGGKVSGGITKSQTEHVYTEYGSIGAGPGIGVAYFGASRTWTKRAFTFPWAD